VSELQGILHGFDVLDAAGALTAEQGVLQDEPIELVLPASDDDAGPA
jgi:hypothetical protein